MAGMISSNEDYPMFVHEILQYLQLELGQKSKSHTQHYVDTHARKVIDQ